MKSQDGLYLAILGYVLPIIFLTYLFFNSEILIPAGYELAIDGYVISRTLVLLFNLYLISKLGIFLYKYIAKDK
ncbi:hypothetical protein [Bacillus kexueae]|uniref:hypothetical protein n=1 Tax=Aeribacillus kexueae TaxID=2078952 RepID=UPI001FAF9AF3|nr:hypothetical protein [Bacillus kexueae]